MNHVNKVVSQKHIIARVGSRAKAQVRKQIRGSASKKRAVKAVATRAHAAAHKKHAEKNKGIMLLSRIATPAEIESIIADRNFSNYVIRNSGKKSIDVIRALANPQTDEDIATKSGVKINEVRRILNDFNKFGFARYNIRKDSKGWLTFIWYIDGDKLNEFTNTVRISQSKPEFKLQDACDDFFICENCYREQKTILPFDAAAEAGFRCDVCGRMLTRISRESAERLISTSVATE
ncbi:MAG: hypothetical protein QW046_01420 [Candidatus Micrarchaeaceae archaeon]